MPVVDSVHAVIGAIRNHLGLGIVPSYLVQAELRAGKLVIVGDGSGVVKSRISLLRHPRKKQGIATLKFIDFLKKSIKMQKTAAS